MRPAARAAWAANALLHLSAAKTKTRRDRSVPISSRLKAILDMRRHGPDGQELPPNAYVFGNEVGEPIANFKRAWERAVLVAHGHNPTRAVPMSQFPKFCGT